MGAGKPAAMEPAGEKELGGLNWLFCLTGKLKAYWLSGKGMMLAPYPPRTTVISLIRYDTPTRGAKLSFAVLTPRSPGTLP